MCDILLVSATGVVCDMLLVNATGLVCDMLLVSATGLVCDMLLVSATGLVCDILLVSATGGADLDGFITNVHMFKEGLCHREQCLSTECEQHEALLNEKHLANLGQHASLYFM